MDNRTLFFADVHNPYADMEAWGRFLEFAKDYKPDTIINLGDWLDCYQLSRFDKDPGRILGLQDDIDTAIELQGQLRAAAPQSRIVYRSGNHESRLIKYLWKHPEMSSLKALRLEELLMLDNFGIEHIPPSKPFFHMGMLCEHGSYVSKHSGATAKKQLEERGVSGISGHVHRAGSHYRTDYSGTKMWFECPCLCSLSPDYMDSIPNWENGFCYTDTVCGHTQIVTITL